MNNIINNNKYPKVTDKIWTKKHSNGDFLIHYLAYQNNSYLINVLKKHENLLLKPNRDGIYLHHILAKNGYFELLLTLLENYPSIVDIIERETNNHLLHYIVSDAKTLRKVFKLFPNIEVNSINTDEITPVMQAIIIKQFDSYKILCKNYKINLNASKRKSELCTILETFDASLKNVKKWIVEGLKRGLELDKTNFDGNIPILYCYLKNQIDTLQYLIKKGANINNGGFGKNFILFQMVIKKDWKTINYFINKFDFNVKNLKWNNVLLHFLMNVSEFEVSEIIFLASQISDLNQANVDGNTVFHLIPPELITLEKKFFSKNYINIWASNQEGISVLDIWYKSTKFNELIDIWYKNIPRKLKIKKKYDYKYLSNFKIENEIALPDYNRNYNNIYSAYIDNLIIYIVYIIKKLQSKIFIPLKANEIKFNVSKADSESAKIIKYRLNAKEQLSIRLNNFIEYHDDNTFFFPKLPQKFSKISFYILSIIGHNSNHTNIVIIDTYNKIVERFDPEGYFQIDEKMDKLLKRKFLKHIQLRDYEYIPGKDYQQIQNTNLYQLIEVALNDERPGDPIGFCSAWCLWYFELRVKNKNVHPNQIYEDSLNKIFELKFSIRDYIRSYSLVLVKYKNTFITNLLSNRNRNKDYFSDEENLLIRSKIDSTIM